MPAKKEHVLPAINLTAFKMAVAEARAQGLLALVRYARLSEAKLNAHDQAQALLRQEEDAQYLAEQAGGMVVWSFVDPDKSAYNVDVWRAQYQLMLTVLASTDGLCAYDADRVDRNPESAAILCTLYRENTHLKFLTMAEDDYDLTTEEGREQYYYAILAAQREARRASQRQKRRHRQLKEQGRYVGPRQFGVTGPNNDKEEKREAGLIRKAALDILAGKAVNEVQREWEAAGVIGTKGIPMTRSGIRQMLLSPRMLGLMVRQPEKGAPRTPVWEWTYLNRKGEPVKSQCPAMLTPDVYEALKLELTGRKERQLPRLNNVASYLLSGLCWCLECGKPMNGQWVKRYERHVYRCAQGCGVIHGPYLDAHVEKILKAFWQEQAQAVPVAAEPFSQADELAELDQELADVEQAWKSKARGLTFSRYLGLVADLEEKIAPLKLARSRHVKAQAQTPTTDALADYLKSDLAGKRRMIRQELQRVDIRKGQRGLKGFQPERVDPQWRDAEADASDQEDDQEPGSAAA